MNYFIAKKIEISMVLKIGFAFVFAAAGIAFPVMVATRSLAQQKRIGQNDNSENGYQIHRPFATLNITKAEKFRDVQFYTTGGFTVTKIRLSCTFEEPTAWISQGILDKDDERGSLSRPYWRRKGIPRQWLPRPVKYHAFTNTHTPESIVISDTKLVSFE